jgi:hypothetical protein
MKKSSAIEAADSVVRLAAERLELAVAGLQEADSLAWALKDHQVQVLKRSGTKLMEIARELRTLEIDPDDSL